MLRILFAVLFVSACHWDLNEPGTDPPVAQFYFPAGIQADPNGRYLYVSNGNADLRWGGGTVQAVDLKRFDCAVAQYRGEPIDPAQCPTAADDVAAARCVPDALDPSIIDCDENIFILRNATIRVGNFAGNMKMRIDPKTGQRTLYVAVRGDPSVTRIRVNLDRDPTRPGFLDCFDDVESLTGRPGYDAALNITNAAPGCDRNFLVQTYNCDSQVATCAVPTQQIPGEPFGMSLDEGKLSSGLPYARLLVTHLAAGQVQLIDLLTENGIPVIRNISQSFFVADPTGRRGAFALAPLHAGDPSSSWYMTSNLQPTIATFRVAEAGVIVPGPSISIAGVFVSGADVRDIVVEPGGNRTFITDNNPPSLLVMDTRPRSSEVSPGQPANLVVDAVDVCQTPSHMGVRRIPVAGAPGTPARLRSTIYAVCYLSSQVMVVDPDRPGVIDTILVGRGPNEIAFNFDNSGAPPANGAPRRAYVTNYADSSISEIDLEPGSPTENRVIARIGLPANLDLTNEAKK